MFGLEYVAAFVKVAVNVAFAIVTAWPMYYTWNCIAPKYLVAYVPPVFMSIPYWHIVGIFLVCTFIGEQIQKLIPTIGKVSQTNGKN